MDESYADLTDGELVFATARTAGLRLIGPAARRLPGKRGSCHAETWPILGEGYVLERMFANDESEALHVCQDCGRRYEYDYRRGHSKRQCNSCRTNRGGLEGRRARQALKRRMIAYKGGRCQRCGYERCMAALSFHHVNGKKRFTFAGSHHRSWSSLRSELDKCVLLCLNCHAEEHDLAHEGRYEVA